MSFSRKLAADRSGTGAVEFGLVLGFITIAILGTVVGLGQGVKNSYNDTASKVEAATPKL
jgi:Flp pilus assembly pilin Flp